MFDPGLMAFSGQLVAPVTNHLVQGAGGLLGFLLILLPCKRERMCLIESTVRCKDFISFQSAERRDYGGGEECFQWRRLIMKSNF